MQWYSLKFPYINTILKQFTTLFCYKKKKIYCKTFIISLNMTSQVEPGSGVCEMHICSMIYFSVRLGSHWCKLDEGILHPIRMTGVCDQLLMESGGHGPHWQWVLCVFGSVSGTNLGKNSDTIRTWISEQGRTGPSAVAAAASVWTQPKDLFTWVISFSDFCWNRKHTSGLEPLTGPAKSLRPGLAVSGHSHMRQSSLIAHVNEACMIRSGLFLQISQWSFIWLNQILSPRSHQWDLLCDLKDQSHMTSHTLFLTLEPFKMGATLTCTKFEKIPALFLAISCVTCIDVCAWSCTDVSNPHRKLHWPVALKLCWSSMILKQHSVRTEAECCLWWRGRFVWPKQSLC